ncbi:MAG: hypothetical protein ACOH2Q_23450 [Rhodococcus sp. (in: high G+C Gram-positive bacteria)]
MSVTTAFCVAVCRPVISPAVDFAALAAVASPELAPAAALPAFLTLPVNCRTLPPACSKPVPAFFVLRCA